VLEEPLAELSGLVGLPTARGSELLESSAVLTSVPARLDGEDDRGASRPVPGRTEHVWRFRHGSSPTSGRLPSSWGHPDDPLVYVTFGSVAGGLGLFAALYELTLRALADLPVRVLLTTGDGGDPVGLQPPPNARVERWWPQADVMPAAAAMVGHGGFGTTMAALVAGVPQVVMPLFAFDQFVNADRVVAVGAGLQLLGGADAVQELPAALSRLLADPAFGAGARAVAAEIADLPDVAGCVPVLEELVARSS
jgi:UDP:flavonoid glycosyltransferase YjiC (YdhE family)